MKIKPFFDTSEGHFGDSKSWHSSGLNESSIVGFFLLRAVRDPVANRSLIAFGGWANLAHAAVMAAQEYRNVIDRQELVGVVVFAIVGVVLVALTPAKQSVERTSAIGA